MTRLGKTDEFTNGLCRRRETFPHPPASNASSLYPLSADTLPPPMTRLGKTDEFTNGLCRRRETFPHPPTSNASSRYPFSADSLPPPMTRLHRHRRVPKWTLPPARNFPTPSYLECVQPLPIQCRQSTPADDTAPPTQTSSQMDLAAGEKLSQTLLPQMRPASTHSVPTLYPRR